MSGFVPITAALARSRGLFASALYAAYKRSPSALLIAAIGAGDWIWNLHAGLRFTAWHGAAVIIGLLLLVALYYAKIRFQPAAAELPFYGALWVAFTCVGCILTYLAASVACPLVDARFAAFDATLGFDWIAWVGFVRAHPILNFILFAAYGCIMPQIMGSFVLFSFARIAGRNEELLLNSIIALLVTALISALAPALGPSAHFGYAGQRPEDMAVVAELLKLRHRGMLIFALPQLQGIVVLPSYHTVLAILFVYAHRGVRWTALPVAALNALMLVSIPSEGVGGHYLADIAAGAMTAFLAIAVTRVARPDLRALAMASRHVPPDPGGPAVAGAATAIPPDRR